MPTENRLSYPPNDNVAPCAVCGRDYNQIKVYIYSFGIKKELIDFSRDPPITLNPAYIEIPICVSDLNLISKIKRNNKGMSPKQLIDAARSFRNQRKVS